MEITKIVIEDNNSSIHITADNFLDYLNNSSTSRLELILTALRGDSRRTVKDVLSTMWLKMDVIGIPALYFEEFSDDNTDPINLYITEETQFIVLKV